MQEELLERIFRWIEASRHKEKVVRLRSRPIGTRNPEELSPNTVEKSINRAKKDIASLMPRCGEYLEKTVVQLSKEKWVYKGEIRWNVKGI